MTKKKLNLKIKMLLQKNLFQWKFKYQILKSKLF